MLDSEMDPEAGTALIKRVRLFPWVFGCLGVFGEFGIRVLIPRSLQKMNTNASSPFVALPSPYFTVRAN